MAAIAPEAPALPAAPSAALPPAEKLVTTRHEINVNGRSYNYAATCGTMLVSETSEKDGEHLGEKAKLSLFYVAYTGGLSSNVKKRPITFCFNGGPGSSSVWVHMGLFGPKRVEMADADGNPTGPPYALTINEASLLTHSDLVFIDPAGTGFSRMLPGEKTREFHDYKRDLDSVAEFIRLYVSRNNRWGSPKYIAGESYGTARACGLAALLQDKHGMYLNGLVLISCAMDFQLLRHDVGNDLPPVLFLPTYSATAWYHNALSAEMQAKPLAEVLAEAEAFAAGEYSRALFAGDALVGEARAKTVATLARLTGLSPAYIESTRLRINIHRFCKQLLREQGVTVGRLDSRYTNFDRDSAGEQVEFDPASAALSGAYSSAFNDYVRGELKFEHDAAYVVSGGFYLNWGWAENSNKYAAVSESLRKAMTTNPHLRVFVANGYYDLATPHFAADYLFNHLALPAALRGNITSHYYEAGHMMYAHKPSLDAMGEQLRAFVRPES